MVCQPFARGRGTDGTGPDTDVVQVKVSNQAGCAPRLARLVNSVGPSRAAVPWPYCRTAQPGQPQQQLAEQAGEPTPDRMQQLLHQAGWDTGRHPATSCAANPQF